MRPSNEKYSRFSGSAVHPAGPRVAALRVSVLASLLGWIRVKWTRWYSD
jgi:hypothetical protein